MLQHLESIQVIVNALVEEDYELAKGLTQSHLGFFMHRHLISPAQPQARQDAPLPEAQQQPEYFYPPITTWLWRIMRRRKSWRASSPQKT